MKIAICVPTRGNDIYYKLMLFCCAESRKGRDVLSSPCNSGAAVSQGRVFDQVLEGGYDAMFLIDSDVCPPDDALDVLLAHKLDIVSVPTLMTSGKDVHWNYHADAANTRIYASRQHTGLGEVMFTSFASVLIGAQVLREFRNRGESWFGMSPLVPQHLQAGIVSNGLTDHAFFNKARAMGFKIFMDFNLRNGVHHKYMVLDDQCYVRCVGNV
jgi:hypothetical protein